MEFPRGWGAKKWEFPTHIMLLWREKNRQIKVMMILRCFLLMELMLYVIQLSSVNDQVRQVRWKKIEESISLNFQETHLLL